MHLSQLSAEGQTTLPQEIREFLALQVGDLIAYEMREGVVILKRAEPFDEAFHQTLSSTLEEWDSPEDDEAFRDLRPLGGCHRSFSFHRQGESETSPSLSAQHPNFQ